MSKVSTRDKILNSVFKEVYAKGYNGTSTSMILKDCHIPKGSLYHYFPSKKEMVLAVIREVITPKMESFFHFDTNDDKNIMDSIIDTIKTVANNDMLISYGCPLHRLNQEMSSIDKDFEDELNIVYEGIKHNLKIILDIAVKKSQISAVNTDSLTEFIIASLWGSISLSPKQSSKERFLETIDHLLSYLNSLKK